MFIELLLVKGDAKDLWFTSADITRKREEIKGRLSALYKKDQELKKDAPKQIVVIDDDDDDCVLIE